MRNLIPLILLFVSFNSFASDCHESVLKQFKAQTYEAEYHSVGNDYEMFEEYYGVENALVYKAFNYQMGYASMLDLVVDANTCELKKIMINN